MFNDATLFAYILLNIIIVLFNVLSNRINLQIIDT